MHYFALNNLLLYIVFINVNKYYQLDFNIVPLLAINLLIFFPLIFRTARRLVHYKYLHNPSIFLWIYIFFHSLIIARKQHLSSSSLTYSSLYASCGSRNSAYLSSVIIGIILVQANLSDLQMTSSGSMADSLPYVVGRATNVMSLRIYAEWVIDESRPYLVATSNAFRDSKSGYVGVAVKVDAYLKDECIGTLRACTTQCSPDEHLTIQDAETMGIRKALCILCTRDLALNYTQCILHSDSKDSLEIGRAHV